MDQLGVKSYSGNQNKKLIVGWFSFTCSEDSTILLTELLNEHFDEWNKRIEFRHFKTLKTKNLLSDLDLAFIEGAISSENQAQQVREIRSQAKFVTAVGSCACTGMPSASRNAFTNKEIDEKVAWYLSHFDYSRKVKKLSDVIQVDDSVEGCPMSVERFLEVLGKYRKFFQVV